MHRPLSPFEIDCLLDKGCVSDDWSAVTVVDDFATDYIRNVQFSGNCRLGTYHSTIEQPGGVVLHSGIFNVHLHNVSVGNDCYLHNIKNYIANYDIADRVIIENTNIVVVDGESTFGNGVPVPVMNETGGREIVMYDNLTAQMAYILAFYRHDKVLIKNIECEIAKYVASCRATRGRIENDVKIVNCGSIKNVNIGSHAAVIGTSKLSNGTINSNQYDPVHIGSGVKCTDFIISSGASITDSTLISRCFIGQSVVMGKHYSALDSLFFANCQGFHGEATAIFAGPYTVSHHKSTLLIAGMYSFLNAGSGSNQSNHMYKLGPIHQGMAERGSKTTSDSYLLWPARIGAFTLVMGRHTKHSDTSNMPFSYLIENATESYLVPAVNLRSVGTVRDAQKWPKRDNRHDPHQLDLINYNLLSPYTIQKMYNGVAILNHLKKISGPTNDFFLYQNCRIRSSSLANGIRLYQMAILKFLGNSLISRISKRLGSYSSFADLIEHLKPTSEIGLGEWVDISGLIVPKDEIQRLIDDIDVGGVILDDIDVRFRTMHSAYYDYEWTWAYEKLLEFIGKPIDSITPDDLIIVVEQWKKTVVDLDHMLYNDAKKEFDLNSQTGFGIDGDERIKAMDFESVRGCFEENSFVLECLHHIEVKSRLGDDTIELLNSLKYLQNKI